MTGKAQRGGGGIAVTYSQPGARKKVGGQHQATAALSPGNTRYPLYRRLET